MRFFLWWFFLRISPKLYIADTSLQWTPFSGTAGVPYREVWLLVGIVCRIIRTVVGEKRTNHSELLLGKGVLKIWSKFTREHSWRSVILIKLFHNFIENTLRHGWFPVNLQQFFRTPFYKNASGGLLLKKENHFWDLISY